jgi:hypothetical protein
MNPQDKERLPASPEDWVIHAIGMKYPNTKWMMQCN